MAREEGSRRHFILTFGVLVFAIAFFHRRALNWFIEEGAWLELLGFADSSIITAERDGIVVARDGTIRIDDSAGMRQLGGSSFREERTGRDGEDGGGGLNENAQKD